MAGALVPLRSPGKERRATTIAIAGGILPCLPTTTTAPRTEWVSLVMRPQSRFGLYLTRTDTSICHPSITYHHFFFMCICPSRHHHQSSVKSALTSRTYELVSLLVSCFCFSFKTSFQDGTYSVVLNSPLFLSFNFSCSIHVSIDLYLTCTVNIPSLVLILVVRLLTSPPLPSDLFHYAFLASGEQ